MSYLNITITTNTNLSFVTGGFIEVIHDSSNYIFGQVVSYNSSTGSLTFKPITVTGSGTYTSWTIVCSGAPGDPGTSGTSGTSGINGTSGSSGTSGIDGTSGISGTSGTSGVSGTSGTSGIDGTSGVSGTSGTSGTDGVAGTSGSSGTSGTSGVDGTSGTSGTSGATGTSGAAGTSGTSGTSGSTPNPNATTTQDYTATAGQTVFTVTGGYTVGQLAVFYNGSKLASNEFTATNGTTFTLAVACQVNDIVQAVASVTGGGVGGGGTNNYVPKFTGSTTIGNSSLQQVGSGWMELGDSSVNTGELDIIGNSGSKVFLYDGYGSATFQTYYNDALTILTQVGGQTTNLINYDYPTKALTFQTNGNNERLRITSTGNVGIGTSSPSFKLDVTGTGRFTDALTATQGNFFQTAASGFAINMKNRNANQQWSMVVDVNAVNDKYLGLYDATSGAYRMVYTNTGNVGIGTTSPNEKLYVNGAIVTNSFLNNNQTSAGAFDFYAGVTRIFSYGSGGTNGIIGFYNGTDSGSASERMRIGAQGNVGIATVNDPDIRLYLKGQNSSSSQLAVLFQNSNSNNLFYVRNDGFTVVNANKSGEVFQVNNIRNNGSSDFALVTSLGSNDNNTSNYHYIGATGGADRVYIYGNGNIVNANGSYGTLSDISLKENIVDATPKLDDLLKLKVRNFNLIDNDDKQIGFIAQEFEEVFPTMVDTDGKSGMKTIKTSVLVPMLVKAIQELKLEIDELKNKN